MNWPLRLAQWVIALHVARQRVPWFGLVRAVLSGPVPREVWRRRLRYGCFQCPLFNRERLTCRGVPKQVRHLGCDCYVVFSAMTAEPYEGGCWGRAHLGQEYGWSALRIPWWRRPFAVLGFALRR